MYESVRERADLLPIQLHTEAEFFNSLTQDIAATEAGDRISMTTLCFEPSEPYTQKVVREVESAAQRDVEVKFGVDAYSFLINNGRKMAIGPYLLPLPFGQDVFRRRQAALDHLAEFPSIETAILNIPGHKLSNPYGGRSHIKAAVVNNRNYILGPNLRDTARIDTAISFEDSQTADRLHDLIATLVRTGNTREALGDEDQIWQLDPQTDLLIDAGKKGQSVIMDRAASVITNAQERILFSSQFFPRGRTAKLLGAAICNDIGVSAFFNHPDTLATIGATVERLVVARARLHLPPALFAHMLPVELESHIKGLATESEMMTGNHNFDPRGVKFGTAEISVHRRDAVFADEFGQFVLKRYQTSNDQGV